MVNTVQVNAPSDGYLGKYYTRLIMGEYKRPTPFSSSKFNTKKIIYLPLPTDLRDNTSVGYTDINLESVGDVINGVDPIEAAALRYSGDAISGAAQVLGQIGGMAASRYGGPAGGALAGIAGSVVSKVVRPEQITSAFQQQSGTAPNPNPSVMFTGPELRNFGHSWTFYPKTMSETSTIKRIIEYLKRSALPENKFSGDASILRYPNMVQINFFPWDSGSFDSNPWGWSENSIIKYKKAVMKNVNVNYTPAGAPGFFHETNGPVAINISIEFMEIEYMLSGDWISGGTGATDTGVEREVDIVAENNRNAGGIPGTVAGANF